MTEDSFTILAVDDSRYHPVRNRSSEIVLYGTSHLLECAFRTILTRQPYMDNHEVSEGIFYVIDSDCHFVWKIDTMLDPSREIPSEMVNTVEESIFSYYRWNIPPHIWMCVVGSLLTSL